MKQLNDYSDKRLRAFCVYCGGSTATRDHVPSRILLDPPYPPNLPVVPACPECNNSFALDEEYLACLVECVICGSTTPEEIKRERIGTILRKKPALAVKLSQDRAADSSGKTLFRVEEDRVRNVLLKLARGHASYELGEPQLNQPMSLNFAPLDTLSPEARDDFESPPSPTAWPEVGSRAMQRLIEEEGAVDWPGWVVVQSGRYRYSASIGEGTVIRIVISEYLAGEVTWG